MRGVVVIFMLVFALVGSSCNVSPVTNIGGIDLEVLTNQPPDVLRENQYFSVSLKLKNNIPHPVSDINVCVFDILGSEYGGINSEECQSLSISGADHEDDKIIPEEAYVVFPEHGGSYVYHNLQFAIH